MFHRNRFFFALIVAQAGCLIGGLWAHGKFAAAAELHYRQQAAIESGVPFQGDLPVALKAVVTGFSFLWIGCLQGIVAWLMINRFKGESDRQQLQVQEEALIKTKELVRMRDAIVFGLAKLAESRDPDTGMHLERIALYSTRLATALRKRRKYRDDVTSSFVNTIGISSALHDIGKVGVEDSILLKPGSLTPEERYRIQVHTDLGGDCIKQIERRLGGSNFLQMAREIAMHHHERWDGSGYPDGLFSTDIPLAARIVSIDDVYDALSVRRVYKEAYPHEECVEMIRAQAGKQFDPDLVEVFLSIECQFREIAERFADNARAANGAASFRQMRMTISEEKLLEATIGSDFDTSEGTPRKGSERVDIYPIESWTA